MNRKISSIIAVVGGVLIAVLVGLYMGRNALLEQLARKRIQQLETTYDLKVGYGDLYLNGLDKVVLRNLFVVPDQRDTLLTMQSLDVRLNLWQLIRGHVEVENVRLNGLNVTLVKQDSVANYDFLFRKQSPASTDEPQEANYAQRADRILELFYRLLPINGDLHRVCITQREDTNTVQLTIPSFVITDNRFRSEINVLEDTLTQYWTTSGELNRGTHTLKTELYARDRQKVSVPYIYRRLGAMVRFDTLAYSLTQLAGEPLGIVGQARISGLDVFHKALSPEAIRLDRGQLTYRVNLFPQAVELDSATVFRFNRLAFHPYLRVAKSDSKYHFTASIHKPWFPADELFSSLPTGLFTNLDGIRTSGSLAYTFLLDVDFARLDSLRLVSELKEKDFRIVKYGATNLSKMSEEFMYTAYENGQAVRTFPIGPSWEHFTPLDSISPLLQMSIMQSEDGAFFYHRGFLPDAMREALIHDLKVRRFARGGSTITMQLVKNVFLNRNKNFARKLEEALIVWLIETERLTSKERMYEVYLNIAEWGPNIYGAKEAASYYFNKRPSQLTVQESIFLASIIPKPKHFKRSFTEDMKLKEHMEGYYRLITERLLKKGLIDEAQADSIRAEVNVTGEAKKEMLTDQ
ncbi:biosynthetic peptidoglycan transglycosylase [Bacteroides sp.]|uniref:biosynthetic peptidoglycan transglycosylase n=1 Tax=Bacteroides sp. TaxID=29523 RepID=UPI002FC83623